MNEEIKYHVDCSEMSFEEYNEIHDWFDRYCAVVIDSNDETHCFTLIWGLDVSPKQLRTFPTTCIIRRHK